MKGSFSSIPCALSIAGSDCSAGAGIQADLKTFSAHHVYGLTAVTCIVAEVPGRVEKIQEADPAILDSQLELLFRAFPIAAIKTGMLYSAPHIEVVVKHLRNQIHQNGAPYLVVDPVMVATSGDSLLEGSAIDLYRSMLFPMATLVTPNMDEARELNGARVLDLQDLRATAKQLSSRYGVPFLVKGGHLEDQTATDVLSWPDGAQAEFRSPMIEGVSTHGTGCSYSAAITCGLAMGKPLEEAITGAKRFVSEAIRRSFVWTTEHHPTVQALNHISQQNPHR